MNLHVLVGVPLSLPLNSKFWSVRWTPAAAVRFQILEPGRQAIFGGKIVSTVTGLGRYFGGQKAECHHPAKTARRQTLSNCTRCEYLQLDYLIV